MTLKMAVPQLKAEKDQVSVLQLLPQRRTAQLPTGPQLSGLSFPCTAESPSSPELPVRYPVVHSIASTAML